MHCQHLSTYASPLSGPSCILTAIREVAWRTLTHLPGGRGGIGIAQLGRGGKHAILVGWNLRSKGQRAYAVLAQLPYVQQPHL